MTPRQGGEAGAVLVKRVAIELALTQATMDVGRDEPEELPVRMGDQVGIAYPGEVEVVGQVSEDLRPQVEGRRSTASASGQCRGLG